MLIRRTICKLIKTDLPSIVAFNLLCNIAFCDNKPGIKSRKNTFNAHIWLISINHNIAASSLDYSPHQNKCFTAFFIIRGTGVLDGISLIRLYAATSDSSSNSLKVILSLSSMQHILSGYSFTVLLRYERTVLSNVSPTSCWQHIQQSYLLFHNLSVQLHQEEVQRQICFLTHQLNIKYSLNQVFPRQKALYHIQLTSLCFPQLHP